MRTTWEARSLGDVCRIIGGGTPSKGIARYWQGEIPWVSPKDMKSDIVVDSIDHISEEAVACSATSIIPKNAVLMVVRSGILARIVPIAITGREVAINQDIKAFCPCTDLNPRFLFHFLNSRMDDLLADVSRGATVHRLMVDQIRRLCVPLPPLSEQRRIVGILDEAFENITVAKTNAEKNLQNTREVFQSQLNSAFSHSATAWKETKLEAVLLTQPQNGWSPPAANHSDSGTPVLTLSSVTGFRFKPEKVKFTTAPVDTGKHYWVRNGDLLITRSNTPDLVGHVAIASGIEKPTIFPDLIMRMNPNPQEVVTEFLYFQLRTSALRSEITGRAQGANPTMKKVNNEAVRTLPIRVPSIEIQKKAVTQLDALSAETRRLESIYERKLAALDELKKSLLHQAFTGQL